MADTSNNSDEIVDLKVNLAKMDVIVTKLDKTTDQLTQISKDVSNILAVHEQKLDTGERYFDDLRNQIVSLINNQSSMSTDAETKLNKVKDDLINERIKPLEDNVHSMQKRFWMGAGALSVIMIVIEYLLK